MLHEDIFRVSIPLAAGVFSAAFFIPEAALYHCGGIAFPLCLVLCVALRHRCLIARPEVIFYILGLLCYCSRRLVLPDIISSAPFGGAKSSILQAIDAMPFEDRENNALVKALIIGDRSSLNRSTTRAFRDAGAAHLLALSGMHLGIIYAGADAIIRIFTKIVRMVPFRRNTAAAAFSKETVICGVLVIVVTGLYVRLCGAGASLLRSWLFIFIRQTGIIVSRPQPPGQVFCTALTIHLVIRPESILDLGFQLSYLAMIGIVFLWPRIRGLYNRFAISATGMTDPPSRAKAPGKGLGERIWEAASLSLCAQAFTAPMTVLHFHSFPRHFLLTNLLASPLLGLCLGACIAALALTPFAVPAAIYKGLEMPLTLLRKLLEAISAM